MHLHKVRFGRNLDLAAAGTALTSTFLFRRFLGLWPVRYRFSRQADRLLSRMLFSNTGRYYGAMLWRSQIGRCRYSCRGPAHSWRFASAYTSAAQHSAAMPMHSGLKGWKTGQGQWRTPPPCVTLKVEHIFWEAVAAPAATPRPSLPRKYALTNSTDGGSGLVIQFFRFRFQRSIPCSLSSPCHAGRSGPALRRRTAPCGWGAWPPRASWRCELLESLFKLSASRLLRVNE